MSKTTRVVNAFAFDFLKVLSSQENGNVFYSPFNLFVLLSAVAASESEKTQNEIFTSLKANKVFNDISEMIDETKKVFEKVTRSEQENTMYFGNKILFNKGKRTIDVTRKSKVERMRVTSMEEVSFTENSEKLESGINQWVNEMTFGKIPCIAKLTDSMCRTLLINVGYFHGEWGSKFDDKETELKPFYNGKGNNEIHTMFAADVKCKAYKIIFPDEEVDVLELPFVNNKTMTVILPETVNGLNKIMDRMDLKTISYKEEQVNKAIVFLPSFKLDTEYKLTSALKNIGVLELFSDTEQRTELFHKSVIEVNEDGRAPKFSMLSCFLFPRLARTVRVDHPFLFFIKDNFYGIILFIGKVNELMPVAQ